MRSTATAALFSVALSISPYSSQAQTILRVDVDTPCVASCDGSTWALAYRYLQDAIVAAGVNDEIWLAEGVYYPDDGASVSDDDQKAVFTVHDLYGGFAGTETLRDQRDPSANLTVLSGDIDGNDPVTNGVTLSHSDITGLNSARISILSGTVDGVTITGGYATGDAGVGYVSYGAGAIAYDGAILSNVRFFGNRTRDYASALSVQQATVTVQDSHFEGNASDQGRGAISLLNNGAASVSNTVFRDNSGAAFSVWSTGGDSDLDGVTFADNSGSAVSLDGGAHTIINSLFLGNEGGVGGAILHSNASGSSSLSVTNTVFSGNKASSGGAIYSYSSVVDVTLTNVTFSGNESTTAGNGVWQHSGAAGTGTLVNAIVWDNTDTGSGPHITVSEADALSISYSIIEGGCGTITNAVCGSGNLDADPAFVTPITASAPTETGDLRLTLTSAAFNAGSNAAVPGGVTTDLDGNDRILNGVVEMGAYELAVSADYGDADGDNYLTKGTGAAGHGISGPYLGSVAPDQDDDGQRTAGTADGDDDDGTDDEDGVSFAVPLLVFAGGTNTVDVEVTTYGAGYLSAWVDLDVDGTFTDEASATGEEVLSDEAHGSADIEVTTTFQVTLPASSTTGVTYARIRFCSTQDACDTPGGLAADGEVEDYQVTLVDGDEIPVTSGASLTVSGGNIVITNADGSTTTIPIVSLTNGTLTLTGTSASETVTLSPALLNTSNLTINVNLGDGFDTLALPPGSSGDVTHTFTNANDGQVAIDGGATINYTGLDPIIDNLDAANRVFTFSGFDDTITLTPDGDGSLGNGYSFIDSDFAESVLFKNPSTTLTINAGGGADTVVLGEMDGPDEVSFLGITVNGGDGAGTDTAGDAFHVTPSANYPITVNGETLLGTCPVDALVLNLEGGAVVATQSDPVSGSITFTGPTHQAIAFTNIEAIGEADIEVTLSTSAVYATDQLSTAGDNALVVTATNNGPDAAACVSVSVDPALTTFLGDISTSGDGSFLDPVWDIGPMLLNGTASLTIEGFVNTSLDQTITFTGTAAEDLDASNNTAELSATLGFLFPAKTQVNTAGYITKTITVGAEMYEIEQLLVGIYQGAPGIDGAVWCQVPNEISNMTSTIWPVAPLTPDALPELWRPCSSGLPFPLHPNDFYEAADGTLWLATWGYAGLYKSTDKGQTWVEAWPKLGPGSAPDDVFWTNVYAITEDAADILYISANNGLVFRSLNDGAVWQNVGTLPEGSADTPWSLTAHPTIGGTLYAGLFGKGVYVSEDFGLTWDLLGGAAENEVLMGIAVPADPQNPNSLKAGYVYDLAFAPDAPNTLRLFAGTSKGIWRASVNAADGAAIDAPGWEFMGPVVTLDADPAVTCTLVSVDPACVVPEIRSLSFDASQTPDALFAGSWGHGAFQLADPAVASVAPLALKTSHVTFVSVSPSGMLTVGDADGGFTTMPASSAATATATEPEPSRQELPTGYALGQNYPNPFNPVTRIAFELPEAAHVSLVVYDALGREVAVLVDGITEAGHHAVYFDAADLPTGTYLYRLTTKRGAIARTLVLMK